MHNHAVQIRHGHSRRKRELLGDNLVVNSWVQAARIEAHDEISIAFVQAKNTDLTKFFGRGKH